MVNLVVAVKVFVEVDADAEVGAEVFVEAAHKTYLLSRLESLLSLGNNKKERHSSTFWPLFISSRWMLFGSLSSIIFTYLRAPGGVLDRVTERVSERFFRLTEHVSVL